MEASTAFAKGFAPTAKLHVARPSRHGGGAVVLACSGRTVTGMAFTTPTGSESACASCAKHFHMVTGERRL